MEDSILKSTKKILGVKDDYTAFDLDIITHINSTFAILSQIGVGPLYGFVIDDDVAKWSDINLVQDQLGLVKTYMFLRVRMLFDPPATSFLIEATNNQIREYEMRLSYLREDTIPFVSDDEMDGVSGPPGPPGPPGPQGSAAITSATGEQETESLVWIIDHNLNYKPVAVKFFSFYTDDELEPEDIVYVNDNRILATWPEPTAGTWMVS